MSEPSKLAKSLSALREQIEKLQQRSSEAIGDVQTSATSSVVKIKDEADRAIAELKAQTVSQATSKPKIEIWLPLVGTFICSLIAAIASCSAGSITNATNLLLTRTNTLLTEKAKKDSDLYGVARDHIAALESAFEAFLFEKKIDPKTDPHQLAADLNRMIIADRFGSATATVRGFNDFIVESIAKLQHDDSQWNTVDTFRSEAQNKCHAAIEALQKLEQAP
jgi:hypothetical protein